jgi:hypothetical protein
MPSPRPVIPVLGSATKDLNFIERKVAEHYRVFMAPFYYYAIEPLDLQTGDINVYGEVDYASPVKSIQYRAGALVNLMVKLEPTQNELNKFGLDFPQEAMVTASQKLMRDFSIRPRIGDRFDFNEWRYEIKTAKEGSWFSNSKFAVEWIMTASRVTNP